MPKKRILPYIILGIVHTRPKLTGKRISEEFTNEIGEFWKASHSQVYPELTRMCSDKWLEVTTTEENNKERYYHLTEKGKKVLQDWIEEPITDVPFSNDLFAIKMFFISDKNDPRIKSIIDEQIEMLEKHLEHLKWRNTRIFSEQEEIDQHYGHYLILQRAISRLEGQISWLEKMK